MNASGGQLRMIRLRNALSRLIRVGRNGARTPPFIRIVKDQPCPNCGSKFPNRPKVHDEKGWWWRCYTEDCVVQYYQPEKGVAILRTGERVSYSVLMQRYKRVFSR